MLLFDRGDNDIVEGKNGVRYTCLTNAIFLLFGALCLHFGNLLNNIGELRSEYIRQI